MRKVIMVIFIAFLVASCAGQNQVLRSKAIKTEVLQTQVISATAEPAEPLEEPVEEIKNPYTAYIAKNDYALDLYEPETGCYLGAYILSNKALEFDINNFERITGKAHAIYMYNIMLGENLPVTWLLSCISQMKTPCIVVQPDAESLVYDEYKLMDMAKAIGEFYVPVFVQFAPVEESYNSLEYIDYYRKARKLFREYASNAAFVWAVDISGVYDCMKYYPGDEYVDWVGLSGYKTLDGEQNYGEDIFKGIDYFYNTFQKDKPIMITKLAVSHQSSANFIYQTSMAAAEIKRIYEKIIKEYPRIKAVIYMDFNGMEVKSTKAVRDNFSITDEEEILTAYKQSIADSGFLTECEMALVGDFSTELIKSPFTAYEIDGDFFISEKSILHDLGMSAAPEELNVKLIDNQRYFELGELGKFISISIKEDSESIIINVKNKSKK